MMIEDPTQLGMRSHVAEEGILPTHFLFQHRKRNEKTTPLASVYCIFIYLWEN